MSSRESAIERANQHFDDGKFVEDLTRWVAIPTQSQLLDHQPELYRYLREEIGPFAEAMDHEVQIFDNPDPQRGPILVATHIEDNSRPTLLTYGHGDVVTAFPEEWSEGLDPWTVKVVGDKVYGRGTVDNKGQHLLAMTALARVMEERGGTLGFNSKIIIETGEEQGSVGLKEFILDHTDLLACDVFFGLDGPRRSFNRHELNLGNRGAVVFDLIVDLKRDGGLHSGHWGGVMPDAGIILAQAISSITTPKGKILIDRWRPKAIKDSVRKAAQDLEVAAIDNLPPIDDSWGEPGLTQQEKVIIWTSFVVLAYQTGNPDNPVNSVPSTARARCQVRHTVDVPQEDVIPALRDHLAANGFGDLVAVSTDVGRIGHKAARTDPDDPWVQYIAKSMEKTSGAWPNVSPNTGASGPRSIFKDPLDCPAIMGSHSYSGCGQHGPDEHGLLSLFREGLQVMTGVYYDLGEPGTPPAKGVA
jgi:acetylornithine deacetylase/succinyl-diaminopimelate desuccinylase-like protein